MDVEELIKTYYLVVVVRHGRYSDAELGSTDRACTTGGQPASEAFIMETGIGVIKTLRAPSGYI